MTQLPTRPTAKAAAGPPARSPDCTSSAGTAPASPRWGADTGRVFAAAAEGDPVTAGRADLFARTYAQGAAAMVLTVNPELVVIGGGISGPARASPARCGATWKNCAPTRPLGVTVTRRADTAPPLRTRPARTAPARPPARRPAGPRRSAAP
ncbi:ROK family protein [Streptomyces sp. NPDC088131]|uniref:ROK family protein n=1 Tax=Streptomyces sp. NPDC088131 TaxID=3365826 RepID=UPI00380FE74C